VEGAATYPRQDCADPNLLRSETAGETGVQLLEETVPGRRETEKCEAAVHPDTFPPSGHDIHHNFFDITFKMNMFYVLAYHFVDVCACYFYHDVMAVLRRAEVGGAAGQILAVEAFPSGSAEPTPFHRGTCADSAQAKGCGGRGRGSAGGDRAHRHRGTQTHVSAISNNHALFDLPYHTVPHPLIHISI
jgi:hypothetical protein